MAEETNKTSSKSRFELTVELVKVLAWPIFATFALISFWGPLRLTARQLPNIVSRSETISIAGMSLEVSRGIRRQASPEVRDILASISPEGIEVLLDFSSDGPNYWSSNSSYATARYSELVSLGLLEELPSERLTRENEPDFEYGIELTSLGKETRGFLLELISEFINELEEEQ